MSALLLLLITGCGEQRDPCDGVRDLLDSPAALTLTQGEHSLGWGSDECFQCHQVWTIHQADCVGGVDVDAIQALADPEDPSTCAVCHGDNGVPWLMEDTGEFQ